MSEREPIPPDSLRRLILEELKEPVVFYNLISDWECLTWGLKDWSEKLGDKLLPFRSGVGKVTTAPQWERSCQMTHLTMKEFMDFVERNCSSAAPSWFYFDYKYMQQWFKDKPDILSSVSWKHLGFPEIGGTESTVWIGSDGAHTPCHFDTYGCNLVAQIYGTKQWILFPPQKSDVLLPTRVPYEESSVYSKHNFYSPDLHAMKDIDQGWVITLKPGEVLFVPRHWWHYVENVGTAISINTWLPLPEDSESRLEEAVVKLLVSQLCKGGADTEFLLNPNEEETAKHPLAENAILLDTCMQQFHELQESNKAHLKEEESYDDKNAADDVEIVLAEYKKYVGVVPKYSGNDLKQLLAAKLSRFKAAVGNYMHNVSSTTITIEKLINALCHPDVISTVKTKLCQEFCGNKLC